MTCMYINGHEDGDKEININRFKSDINFIIKPKTPPCPVTKHNHNMDMFLCLQNGNFRKRGQNGYHDKS